MIRYLLLMMTLGLNALLISQEDFSARYINTYQAIAISEMQRTGIPASITLAQGMLESNWGRSELATKSNNHFGIKCSQGWDGDGHFRHDDEYTELGLKKKSCFRVYGSAEESFYDHSDFLTDPSKKDRYGFLFELASDDYESWAHGLRKAGYATDPAYADKLILLIEKHQLAQYDQRDDGFEDIVSIQAIEEAPELDLDFDYRISYHNSCKVVIAGRKQPLEVLAKKVGVSSRKLIRYNHRLDKKALMLQAGEMVYLEKKKHYYLGKDTSHEVHTGQSLQDIAHLYGVDEEYLCAINHIDEDTSLSVGMLLSLKTGYTPARKRSNPIREVRELLVDHSEYLFEQALKPSKP